MAGFRTEDPTTGEIVRTWDAMSEEQVEDALAAAQDAFTTWRSTDPVRRAEVLRRTADLLAQHADELADIAAEEMGKPLAQGVGEAQLCSQIFRYYADNAQQLLADDALPAHGANSTRVEKEPLGVLLGVMPWNYPYYQLARFIAPNLLLGNTLLLKPASICAASALRLEELLTEAGLPEGVYQTLLVGSDRIDGIIADPRVQGVSLTGSEGAGASVAAAAGQHLKKAVLELGGSDPFIVLGGDLDAVAATAAKARLSNAGQACNSPKRMIVLDEHYDEFVEKLTAAFKDATVGDPREEGTQVGPMSSTSAREDLMELVDDAVSHGAQVRTGGHARAGAGAFMEPTVLTGVTREMRAWSEELFGPVAVVHRAADVDEAVALANESDFGLSGSVWSDDLELAEATARRLDVGMAFVNEHGTTQAGLPFGGVGRSGFGRELGPYGVDEFVNKRLVRVADPVTSASA
ncbi:MULTISPECIES: aldehyde dehydrogenase family protein [Micrococcus]|uniref:Succinate-semialdehyde dehydrogenase/glutarate-semialdehyde dehydrogenase n=2 Tax=Micrococcus TaxID=1269 RepID=A0ABR6E2H7_9MICC|nr:MULTISPECIES: aldehyde dehydrogenase family protein [Micrococcus]PFH05523.1 succinate-semialdehyde dehydrogenase/glutarate-semialdehyde dehydrogenase [Micrococcaceae bacterium JKS001869]EFD51457.1 aldehyde dehydrogenase (NAD) family protein [Micrococcus luteus SK58]KWW42922.1 Aldehyde dehydrogenase [Micrococcus luteus]MBA9081840.1 succinate-semialdehyde dehydrogenase/glutarate-semialdehyde dehydrogenase [Micrococcus aloeverae]MBN6768660.1 aldehyde dehydrogenase family protein [Micrococcus l